MKRIAQLFLLRTNKEYIDDMTLKGFLGKGDLFRVYDVKARQFWVSFLKSRLLRSLEEK